MKTAILTVGLVAATLAFGASESTVPTKTPAAKTVVAKKKPAVAVAPAAPAAPAPVRAAAPLTIPKTAVANGDGTFRFTDPKGKEWVYMNTPFGVSRSEIPAGSQGQRAAMPPPAVSQNAVAIDKGDTVRFEKVTPFGTTVWEKKKTELTPEESQIFGASRPQPQEVVSPNAKPE